MKLLPILTALLLTALLLAAVIALAFNGWTNPAHVVNLVAGLAFCQ